MRRTVHKLRHAMLAWMAVTGVDARAQQTQRPLSPPVTRSPDVGDGLSEALLNTRVRLALLGGLLGADGLRVGITVEGGSVYLTGEVKDRASAKLATEVVRAVDGVQTVHSSIRLNSDADQRDDFEAQLQDCRLASQVRMALLQEIGDGALNIRVEAASGVVSLRGHADRVTRRRAAECAKRNPAVRRVDNLLSAP